MIRVLALRPIRRHQGNDVQIKCRQSPPWKLMRAPVVMPSGNVQDSQMRLADRERQERE